MQCMIAAGGANALYNDLPIGHYKVDVSFQPIYAIRT